MTFSSKAAALAVTFVVTFSGLAAADAPAPSPYYTCDPSGRGCRLLKTSVDGSERPYDALYKVHTHFTCAPGGFASGVVLSASSESEHRLTYGADEDFEIRGRGPIAIVDSTKTSEAMQFIGACALSITYEASPSAFQHQLWGQQVTELSTELDRLVEIYAYRRQLLFWNDKYQSDKPTFGPYVTALCKRLRASDSIIDQTRGDLVCQVLDEVPREQLLASYRQVRSDLADRTAAATQLDADLPKSTGAGDSTLEAAMSKANAALREPLDPTAVAP